MKYLDLPSRKRSFARHLAVSYVSVFIFVTIGLNGRLFMSSDKNLCIFVFPENFPGADPVG